MKNLEGVDQESMFDVLQQRKDAKRTEKFKQRKEINFEIAYRLCVKRSRMFLRRKTLHAFTIRFRKDGGDGLRHEQLILARKKGRKPSRLQINLTFIKMSNSLYEVVLSFARPANVVGK